MKSKDGQLLTVILSAVAEGLAFHPWVKLYTETELMAGLEAMIQAVLRVPLFLSTKRASFMRARLELSEIGS